MMTTTDSSVVSAGSEQPGVQVTIHSFEPYSFEISEPQSPLYEVFVVLPPLHVKLVDLSMDGLLPGVHLGADSPLVGVRMRFPTGKSLTALTELITQAKPILEEVWGLAQQSCDKAGFLAEKKEQSNG